jgi:hypothetical protein
MKVKLENGLPIATIAITHDKKTIVLEKQKSTLCVCLIVKIY